MDKWFSTLAMKGGASAADRVKRLISHSKFSWTNPNRMRAVIAVFAMANMTGFNAINGKGYKLVSDAVKKLDDINPQVGARLLTSFRSYKSLEPVRRKLAEAALQNIRTKSGLSSDISDILDRTLA